MSFGQNCFSVSLNTDKFTMNRDLREQENASDADHLILCPLRRLEREAPSVVLLEFAARIHNMPPDHQLLMRKFQNDKDLQHQLDVKFGDNKERMLVHLYDTHKTLFRPLGVDPNHNMAITRWLEQVPEAACGDFAEQVTQAEDSTSNIVTSSIDNDLHAQFEKSYDN